MDQKRRPLGLTLLAIFFGVGFVRIVDGVDLNDPIEAAEGRRVFELHALR